MNRRAFSLIELLVVIAIVALLMGLLLPALAGSRQQSRYVKGQANLRSLSQIMLMYAQEQQDQFLNPFRPVWPDMSDLPGGTPSWATAVSIKDPAIRWDFFVLFCPELQEAHTEGFSSLWYSYLADYRGAGRVTPEQFSPADAQMMEIYQRAKADPTLMEEDRLSPSSYIYSPTMSCSPDRYLGGGRSPMAPGYLLTAQLSTVRHPSAKVFLYERMDFSQRTPRPLQSIACRPTVAAVDGSVDRADMGNIMERIANAGSDGSDRDLMPCFGTGCQVIPEDPTPLFFYATKNGVRGRDLPRQ